MKGQICQPATLRRHHGREHCRRSWSNFSRKKDKLAMGKTCLPLRCRLPLLLVGHILLKHPPLPYLPETNNGRAILDNLNRNKVVRLQLIFSTMRLLLCIRVCYRSCLNRPRIHIRTHINETDMHECKAMHEVLRIYE